MVVLLTEAACVPSFKPRITPFVAQIVLLSLSNQSLRLFHQARHVRDARDTRSDAVAISTRTSAHEAFSRARVDGLETDVAFLALRVVHAFLDRDRDGLRVLLIRMKLLGAACFFYFLAELVMPAFFPVLHLAFRPTITRLQRPHFFPDDKPSSVAQAAHCVRSIGAA